MTASVAQHECGHRFVSASRLDLIVCAVALLAFAAFEQIGFGTLYGGQLGIIDGLFDEFLTQLPHFVAGHLLRRHFGQLLGADCTRDEVCTQRGILRILQIGHTRSHTVLVSHVGVLKFQENGVFQFFGQFFGGRAALWWFAVSFDGIGQHFATLEAHGIGD